MREKSCHPWQEDHKQIKDQIMGGGKLWRREDTKRKRVPLVVKKTEPKGKQHLKRQM